MMSVRPPAATATTAKPLAIASKATNPRVSVSEGIMKMSALAYAEERSSPLSMPCTVQQLPEQLLLDQERQLSFIMT